MSEELTEQNCPLRVVQNIEGTWDILVDGQLTHPRLTQWTEASAEEAVRIIHSAYVARLDEMREALQIIASEGCGVTHASYPKGTTCLDKQRHAREHPEKYVDAYRARLVAGEGRCKACIARAALAQHTEGEKQ